MRRAILLLAALTAGASGCSSNNCPNGGTLTIYWQPPQGGFTSATGQLLACDQAGVSDLDISINGQLAVSHQPCHGPSADGVQLTGFTGETVSVQVDAYDVNNRHLFQDVTSANTAFCQDALLDVNLAALTGDMTVYTTFGPYSTCAQAGVASIYYALYDATGAVYSSGTVPCTDPSPGFVIPSVDFGQYRFRFVQGLDPAGVAIYDICGDVVNFNSANPISLPLQAITGGVTCP